MNDTNPYQSPVATGFESKPATPHGTSIRKEAWRGAKFGAKVTALVLGVVAAVGWLIVAGLTAFHWLSDGVSPLAQDGALLELGKAIGGTIFAIALTSLYGAIAGAMIMGVAALVRKSRATTTDQS